MKILVYIYIEGLTLAKSRMRKLHRGFTFCERWLVPRIRGLILSLLCGCSCNDIAQFCGIFSVVSNIRIYIFFSSIRTVFVFSLEVGIDFQLALWLGNNGDTLLFQCDINFWIQQYYSIKISVAMILLILKSVLSVEGWLFKGLRKLLTVSDISICWL